MRQAGAAISNLSFVPDVFRIAKGLLLKATALQWLLLFVFFGRPAIPRFLGVGGSQHNSLDCIHSRKILTEFLWRSTPKHMMMRSFSCRWMAVVAP
jgi:hypothetical protein